MGMSISQTVTCGECQKDCKIPEGWEGPWYCPDCGHRNVEEEIAEDEE